MEGRAPEGAPAEPLEALAERPVRGCGCCTWVLFVALAGMGLLHQAALRVAAAPVALTAASTGLAGVLLGVSLVCVLWAIWRRTPAALALAGSATMIWLTVWGRAWVAWPASGPADLRVMTWNVQRLGYTADAASERFRCAAAAIERLEPDVLALLEVSAEDVERLSAALDLDCAHIDYLGTGRPDAGGLAACSRSEWQLARNGPRAFVSGGSWYYMFAELVRGDDVFNLLAVHLQPYRLALGRPESGVAEAQSQETVALLELLSRLRDPTVVAGDFNSPRDTAVHHALRGHLRDAWEQAAWGPGMTVQLGGVVPLRVDYVYATPDFGIASAEIPDVGWDCSDHRPVVVDLVLPER